MTPAARISAAIEVLDRILAGHPVEPSLVNWGRAHRFAGSGDRAAMRDLVFDALRCRSSYAALGGGLTGRGLMLGAVRAQGVDPATLFTGIGHAPAPATEPQRLPEGHEALDCPEWLAPRLQDSLGKDFAPVMRAMQARAPVFLRVNLARTAVSAAQALLAADGVETRPHPLAATALDVTGGARRIQTATAYVDGLVELQDAGSQAVVAALPDLAGRRVLDLCAGGGGKTLAMAALGARVVAHDADPARMRDLPARAARARVAVKVTDSPENAAPYDLILTDVPCSGSGSWRRDPAGKWALTAPRLTELLAVQAVILDRAAPMVAPGGCLAYATCSLLADENQRQIDAFVHRTPGWRRDRDHHFTPLQGGDGFFLAILTRI